MSGRRSEHESALTDAEVIRLRGVCDEWATKYEGWRDACLAAEARLDGERTQALVEVASVLEGLRRPNPINGDGSNYMLTRALNEVVALAGDGGERVIAAVREVQDRRAAEDLAIYERLRAMSDPLTTPAQTGDPDE